jgi:hypothetical protein
MTQMGESSRTDGGRSFKIVPLGRWFLRVLYWKTNREVKPSRSPPKTGTEGPPVTIRNVIKNNSQAAAAAAGTVYDAGTSATITSADDYNNEDKIISSGATSCSNDSEFDLLVT